MQQKPYPIVDKFFVSGNQKEDSNGLSLLLKVFDELGEAPFLGRGGGLGGTIDIITKEMLLSIATFVTTGVL